MLMGRYKLECFSLIGSFWPDQKPMLRLELCEVLHSSRARFWLGPGQALAMLLLGYSKGVDCLWICTYQAMARLQLYSSQTLNRLRLWSGNALAKLWLGTGQSLYILLPGSDKTPDMVQLGYSQALDSLCTWSGQAVARIWQVYVYSLARLWLGTSLLLAITFKSKQTLQIILPQHH